MSLAAIKQYGAACRSPAQSSFVYSLAMRMTPQIVAKAARIALLIVRTVARCNGGAHHGNIQDQ